MNEINSSVWIGGVNWRQGWPGRTRAVRGATWPFMRLYLDEKGGRLSYSLPGFLGRAMHRLFAAPDIRFTWAEVRRVQLSWTILPPERGVRFRLLRSTDGIDEFDFSTLIEAQDAEILDFAEAMGAPVFHKTHRALL